MSEKDFRVEGTRVIHIPTEAWFGFNSVTGVSDSEFPGDAKGDLSEMRLWATRRWLQHLTDTMKKKR